jgi:hypothetical protein
MKKCIIFVIVLLITLTTNSIYAMAQETSKDITTPAGDFLNPKSFTKIYEIDKFGNRLPIFINNDKARNSSVYEVDINSKIEIVFDK